MAMGTPFGSFSSPHIDRERDLLDEIDHLREALGEIVDLPDVRADEAASIAERALKRKYAV